jgi:hypothetical protein
VRVVSFVGPDGPRLGVVEGDRVIDLTAVDPTAPRDLRAVLRAGRLLELERLALDAPASARRALDEGARFSNDFPPSCVLLERGVPQDNLDAYVSASAVA